MADRYEGRSRRRWVNINELHVSPSTQRESFSRAWVDSHVGIFDPEKLNLLTVNVRDGKKYVVDGWHRMELLRAVGWGDQQIEANVFEGLTEAEEADLFIGLDDRRKVSRTDLFRVRVTMGDPVAVAINKIVQGLGLRIGSRRGGSRRTITAIQIVEHLYLGAGVVGHAVPDVLHRTLRILRDAYGEDTSTWKAPHVIGLGTYFLHNPEAKDAEVLRRLQAYPGGGPAIEGKIRGRRTVMGGPMAQNAYEAYAEIARKRPGVK